MSWKAEVKTNNGINWASNGLRFATQKEALDYVDDLQFRWTSVVDTRAIEVDEPITHQFTQGKPEPIT